MPFKDPAKRKQYAEEYFAQKVMHKNGELSLQHIHCRGTKYTVAVFCHVSLYFAVEAFYAFDRQLAKNTSVRTTINVFKTLQTRSQFVNCVSLENLQSSKKVPKTFQTRSQFVNCVSLENLQCSKNVPETFQTRSQIVSAEADAERVNQVLSGKEIFRMCPGACDGALSHCALPVTKAHHHFLRMLRENIIRCDYHQCK